MHFHVAAASGLHEGEEPGRENVQNTGEYCEDEGNAGEYDPEGPAERRPVRNHRRHIMDGGPKPKTTEHNPNIQRAMRAAGGYRERPDSVASAEV